MSLSIFNFSLFHPFVPRKNPRGEELEYDIQVIGLNQKILESPEVLTGVNLSFSPEMKTEMVLHSEVQAEESSQEQREDAERLGRHHTSS